MTNWKELIGKRVLLREKRSAYVEEVKILELSPSGRYIKVEWMIGKLKEWRDTEDFDFHYELIEVLD